MAENQDVGNDSGQASGPLGQLRQAAGGNPITQKLYSAGEDYLKSKAENVVSSAAKKLGATTQRLNDVAEGGGKGGMAVKGAEQMAEGKSPGSAAASAVGGGIKDKVKGLFGKGGKGKSQSSGGKKIINIVEDIDVGVPLREAYDQWTQFQEFSSFSKGVTGADKGDDVTSTWKFKIFWSNRSMKATTTEQIPDERIAWTSEGAKGSIKGVVTFHALGEKLTKILLVIEYYPAGFFEKTGNIWRAQGRRARLDLKHYRRFIMMEGEASDGWRGEIRDGEVVQTHEDAIAEEEQDDDYDDDYEDHDEGAEEPQEDDDYEDLDSDEESDDPDRDDEPVSSADDEDYDEYDEDDEDEDEPEEDDDQDEYDQDDESEEDDEGDYEDDDEGEGLEDEEPEPAPAPRARRKRAASR